jgi:hypothetical protein
MTLHKLSTAAGTVLALAAFVATPAHAAKRYASPTSTNAVGSCSSLQPCRLDHAVGGAAAGDEVVVLPGDYDVTYAVDVKVPVNIHGVGGQPRPRLVGGTVANGAVLALDGGGSLRHLHLETSAALGSVLAMQGGIARDLQIFTPATTGVDIRSAAGGAVLADSVVRATGTSPAVETKDGKSDGQVKLLNVTLYAPDATATAVKAKHSGDIGTVIRNSIVRGGSGDVKTYSRARAAVDHSNVRSSGSSYTDAGFNQDADPLFADAAAGDLRPLATSPAIDAGTAEDPNLGPADVDGFKRTLGAAPDMGAHEFVPPGTADPYPPVTDFEDFDAGRGGDGGNGGGSLPPAAPPKAGERMNVETVKGSIRVKPPKGGGGFVDLEDGASVPLGSTVDASHGVVELTTARDASGTPQTGRFWGGRFKVTQRASTGNYTELALTGGNFGACDTRAKVAAAGKRRVRQLWGSDRHGRFRTRGRGGHATVRGTRWLTRDRCDGTLFKVAKGAIDVKPKGKRKAVRVSAGERFLAKRAR